MPYLILLVMARPGKAWPIEPGHKCPHSPILFAISTILQRSQDLSKTNLIHMTRGPPSVDHHDPYESWCPYMYDIYKDPPATTSSKELGANIIINHRNDQSSINHQFNRIRCQSNQVKYKYI